MLNRFFNINSVIGISLSTSREGGLCVNACQITRQGSSLDFDKKITGLTSLEETCKAFKEKQPISLNISGKGVLIKQIQRIDEVTKTNFSQVLPNGNPDDFYVQNFVSGEFSYVAVIRKADADQWIDELKSLGLSVTMLSLGPFPVDHILGQLNYYDGKLIFDGHSIQRDVSGNWLDYRFDENAVSPYLIKIESEKLDEKLVLAYAAAFQLIMGDRVDVICTNNEKVQLDYRNLLAIKWVKAYGSIVIVVAFVLLLANFIFLTWLNDTNANLAYQAGRSAQNISDVKNIDEQVSCKEQKLKILGWNGGISKAFLADQLAGDLPDDMVWQSVAINPPDEKASREQKTMVFKDGLIRIVGSSPQIISVNEWMARVKARRWVKAVSLESYAVDRESNTGIFVVLITY